MRFKDRLLHLMAPLKQRDGEPNRHVGEPDPRMTVVLVVECSVRDHVPLGNRHKAIMDLELKLRPEFAWFQDILTEKGLDASFYINRRTTNL